MNHKIILLIFILFLIPFITSLNETKEITLTYILDGEKNSFNYTVYDEVVNYIESIPASITYENGAVPSRIDFKMKNINNEEQRHALSHLVEKIKNLTSERTDQVRIAISIVQNIPYGFTNKTVILPGGLETNDSRYPYEVLYENEGICGEKTELMAFLLKELGYGVAFFYNEAENHESVGIKCPVKRSLDKSGYCFIETTGPAIISDNSLEYVGGITLTSKSEVYPLFEGESLPNRIDEYKDAKSMKKIRQNKFTFFNKHKKLEKLKQKYGLLDEYKLA